MAKNGLTPCRVFVPSETNVVCQFTPADAGCRYTLSVFYMFHCMERTCVPEHDRPVAKDSARGP